MNSDNGSKKIWEGKNSSDDNLWVFVDGAFIKLTSNSFKVKTDYRENYADNLPATWETTLTMIRIEYVSYISSYTTTTTYICSTDPNAYPDNGATQDNAQYWYIGQPFTYLPRLGKVEVGSYVGTGLSSWGITFENTPQFVHISSNTAPNNQVGFWINPKQVLNYWVRSSSQSTISSILSEKTLSCSSSSAAMNNTNTTY